MPTVERVLADTHGKDPLDTDARQIAALRALQHIVAILDGNEFNGMTPQEAAVWRSYQDAAGRIEAEAYKSFNPAETQRLGKQSPQSQWYLQLYAYERGAGTEEELLQKYFSNDWRSTYIDITSSMQRAHNAAGKQNVNGGSSSLVKETTSKFETYNTAVRSYLALSLVFCILWIVRILRAFEPIRTSHNSPPQFEGRWKNLTIHSFAGYVRGAATRSDTSIIGGNNNYGGITSTTTVTKEFRLVSSHSQQEQNLELQNWNIQLWDGQLVSVAWAIRKGRKSGPYFLVVNHTTGQHFVKDNVVRQIVKRPSLFWSLSLVICIFIPPVWLLGIFWELLISIQSKRFMRSGVLPLVKVLNQKAAVSG